MEEDLFVVGAMPLESELFEPVLLDSSNLVLVFFRRKSLKKGIYLDLKGIHEGD